MQHHIKKGSDMSSFIDNISYIVDNAKDEFVERLAEAVKEETVKIIDADDIIKQLNVPYLVRQAIYDHFRQFVTNEIGNRLRCGIYDGTKVDTLFESVWTEELDKAIEDRIRSRIYKSIDDVIAERLKQLK